jgi:hypothetical protein
MEVRLLNDILEEIRHEPVGQEVSHVRGIVSDSLPFAPTRLVYPGFLASSAVKDTAFASCFDKDGPALPRICAKFPFLVAAGGCVASAINRWVCIPGLPAYNYDCTARDLDLYVCADSAEQARGLIMTVCDELHPIGDVVMSEYALSLCVPEEVFDAEVLSRRSGVIRAYSGRMTNQVDAPEQVYYRVQIIAQPLPTADLRHGLERIFATYDLPCCRFAVQGTNVYTTREAVETVFCTRVNRVTWRDAMNPGRLAKYYRRRYDFLIIGDDGNPLPVDSNSECMRSMRVSLDKAPLFEPNSKAEKETEGDHCYTRLCMPVCARDPMWVLDLSFEAFLAGDELPGLVCGNAPSDIAFVLNTGKNAPAKLSDWMYSRMNRFCNEVLIKRGVEGRMDDETQRLVDSERDHFATKMEKFGKVMQEDHGISPFGSKAGDMFKHNTNLVEFSRYWCEPCLAKKKKRGNVPVHAPYTFSADSPTSMVMRDMPTVVQYGSLFFPGFSGTANATEEFMIRKLTVHTPLMMVTGWFNQGEGERADILMLSMPESWMAMPEYVAFDLFMKQVWHVCCALLLESRPAKSMEHSLAVKIIGGDLPPCIKVNKDGPPTLEIRVPILYHNRANGPMPLLVSNGKVVSGFEKPGHFPLDVVGKTVEATITLEWIFYSPADEYLEDGWLLAWHWSTTNIVAH